jgi:hypothetical protein
LESYCSEFILLDLLRDLADMCRRIIPQTPVKEMRLRLVAQDYIAKPVNLEISLLEVQYVISPATHACLSPQSLPIVRPRLARRSL